MGKSGDMGSKCRCGGCAAEAKKHEGKWYRSEQDESHLAVRCLLYVSVLAIEDSHLLIAFCLSFGRRCHGPVIRSPHHRHVPAYHIGGLGYSIQKNAVAGGIFHLHKAPATPDTPLSTKNPHPCSLPWVG